MDRHVGSASALSRTYDLIRLNSEPFVMVAHHCSPLGGTLLFIDRSFLVYASVVVYLVIALCAVLLHETAGQGGENGERAMMQ